MNKMTERPQAPEVRRVPSSFYRTMVRSGRAPVNGFQMYYEIHGTTKGRPLVSIHGAWGTANVFPTLAANRQLIAIELQGHGRSTDTDRPLTYEQEADDVAALLKHLGIEQADFFGESAGGVVAVMMAVRHPELVGRVACYAADFTPLTGAFRSNLADAYPFQFYREGYERVAPDPTRWPELFAKVCGMQWKGFSQDELRSIKGPVLLAHGDHDSDIPVERALAISRLIPDAQLAVVPGAGHFVLSSNPEKVCG